MVKTTEPPRDEVTVEIEGILTPIKKKREALVTQEDELKQKLATVQGGIRSLDRILTAAQPKSPPPKPARKVADPRFSEENLTAMLGKFKEQFGDKPFTVTQAVEQVGITKARAYPTTRALHAQGLLLKVGVDKENRGAILYKVAPEGS